MIEFPDTYVVFFYNENRQEVYETEIKARTSAEKYVGNASANECFPGIWLYGPGTGTTSAMVRRVKGLRLTGTRNDT